MKSDQIGDLINQTKAKDFRALARFLSRLEEAGPKLLAQHPELLKPAQMSYRFGITGPPGAGKSTLIGRLIGELRSRGKTVGVLAVDPSSPFSRGAVLGDRIRYTEHFSDPGVFIRSVGSRGSLGGLSSATYLMVRAFDWAGFDYVLIETVGVGQTELEIMNVADWVSVVLVPESGDSIQAMKAGLLEIANLFIINKSDRPGADIFTRELEASLSLDPDHQHARLLSTIANQGKGVTELAQQLVDECAKPDWRQRRLSPKRLQAEAAALLRIESERSIALRVQGVDSAESLAQVLKQIH